MFLKELLNSLATASQAPWRFLTISDTIPTSVKIGSYMHNYIVSIAWFTGIINDCNDCEGTKIDEIELDFLCDILAIFHRWHLYSLS